MQQVTTVGLDLAKNLFQVHGADAQGRPVLRRRLAREKVLEFFANLPPCLVGLEACAAAHYWARELAKLGRHRQVKLEGDGEAPRLARAANLWGGFGASDLGPHRERLRADGSVLGGRKVIAVEVEEVVDLVVRREEPLHLSG